MADKQEPIGGPHLKFNLEVMWDVVMIRITCKDRYEAQVIFDDLTERLKNGQTVSIHGTGEKDGQRRRRSKT